LSNVKNKEQKSKNRNTAKAKTKHINDAIVRFHKLFKPKKIWIINRRYGRECDIASVKDKCKDEKKMKTLPGMGKDIQVFPFP
jgi:hypothetical protein